MDNPNPSQLRIATAIRRRTAIGLGLTGALSFARRIRGDEGTQLELSRETMLLFGRFERAIKDLEGFLTAIEFQKSAIIGINYFGISVGGIDAIKDLEESRGVDPETFAGLHAGFAIPAVAEHLNLTKTVIPGGEVSLKIEASDGRLRYKKSAVRLYSPDKLRELFVRRDSFRTDDDRKRTAAFGSYVVARQQKRGRVVKSASSDRSEVQELSERYRKLKPLIGELESALQSEGSSSSILQTSNPHFFGYSLGGIDVTKDLSERGSVDPETLAAIYADRISPDFADSFELLPGGQVKYNGNEVRMYSMKHLEFCFKQRERLSQMARLP